MTKDLTALIFVTFVISVWSCEPSKANEEADCQNASLPAERVVQACERIKQLNEKKSEAMTRLAECKNNGWGVVPSNPVLERACSEALEIEASSQFYSDRGDFFARRGDQRRSQADYGAARRLRGEPPLSTPFGGWLGVEVANIDPNDVRQLKLSDSNGALVKGIVSSGPASAVGLKVNDVIVAVDSNQIKSRDDLVNQIGAIAPETSVNLTIVRDGATRAVPVRLAAKPASQGSAEESSPKTSEAMPEVANKPRSRSETADERKEVERKFRTQRGVSYVERRDKSFLTETPEICAIDCMKSPTCGRATFWFGSSRCFLFSRGARTEGWGYKDNNAISFSFE